MAGPVELASRPRQQTAELIRAGGAGAQWWRTSWRSGRVVVDLAAERSCNRGACGGAGDGESSCAEVEQGKTRRGRQIRGGGEAGRPADSLEPPPVAWVARLAGGTRDAKLSQGWGRARREETGKELTSTPIRSGRWVILGITTDGSKSPGAMKSSSVKSCFCKRPLATAEPFGWLFTFWKSKSSSKSLTNGTLTRRLL